jgi:phage shock protein A
MVARIENHDELVRCSIQELQSSMARAQVRLSSVRRDGASMRNRLAAGREAEAQWKDRARASMDEEERALECLRRSKRAARLVTELEERITEHDRVESRLVKDIRALQEGLRDLKEQRNMMRARQTRAEAMGAVRDNEGMMSGEVREILDRWEIQIKEREFNGDCAFDPGDELEETFCAEEERAALRIELDELRRSDA